MPWFSSRESQRANLWPNGRWFVDLRLEGCGFDPRRVGNILSWKFDHEIFSKVILSLPLIEEVQLSVSGERMCTILVYPLEDETCPVNVWLGKLTALDTIPLGWPGRKTSTQTNKNHIHDSKLQIHVHTLVLLTIAFCTIFMYLCHVNGLGVVLQ